LDRNSYPRTGLDVEAKNEVGVGKKKMFDKG
jgi:hypothetical protein